MLQVFQNVELKKFHKILEKNSNKIKKLFQEKISYFASYWILLVIKQLKIDQW